MGTEPRLMPDRKSFSAYERIRAIFREDSSFRPEAYYWIFDALEHTLRALPKPRHVSGQELCHGIRALAIERFGPLARTVFRSWGVTRTADFGRIVFHLIDAGLMGKTDTDAIKDFENVFDFATAFDGSHNEAPLADIFQNTEPGPEARHGAPVLS
jgi:uncharacterized repeat protein (TIGR04138 family)